MGNQRGTTPQRGYGYWHRKARDTHLARFTPGQPCARCGKPIYSLWLYRSQRRISAVDLGHNAARTAYTGLEHAACNRAAAARLANARRKGRALPAVIAQPSRQW